MANKEHTWIPEDLELALMYVKWVNARNAFREEPQSQVRFELFQAISCILNDCLETHDIPRTEFMAAMEGHY